MMGNSNSSWWWVTKNVYGDALQRRFTAKILDHWLITELFKALHWTFNFDDLSCRFMVIAQDDSLYVDGS